MKTIFSFTLIFICLLFGTQVIAECTVNRNSNILITKPDTIYTNNGDGTVTDKKTGLMWQRCLLGMTGPSCATGTATKFIWHNALIAANENTDNGYSDWRVPNINELASLLEDACANPMINSTLFPATTNNHWSSSPFRANELILTVDFRDGGVDGDWNASLNVVRLVRGGF